jgi:sigma-B regulation protein RsbU (phosphoserine phosphatase)
METRSLQTAREEPDRRIRILEFLVQAARQLNECLDLDKLLAATRDLVRDGVEADAVCLFLLDEDRGKLQPYIAYNRVLSRPEVEGFDPREGLAGWVFQESRPARIADASGDQRMDLRLAREFRYEVRTVLAVPLRRGRKTKGVLQAVNRRGGSFTQADEDLLVALADSVAVALENALLYRQVQREKLETESLYRIGLKLNQTLELKEILPLLLDLLGQVVPYDAAAIYLIDPSGTSMDLFHSRGYDASREERVQLKLGQGAVGWVAKTGEPLLMEDVGKDPRYVNARPQTRSELVVPMVMEGKVIGAFNLESDRLAAFGPSDVQRVMTFATQAAISIERARLHEEALEKRRLEQEVRIARAIQERCVPDQAPEIGGFRLAGLNVPSLEVSGDLFDYIPIVPGHLGIMIADVAGKGIPAALVGATFRASLRAEVRNNYAISTILSKVNALLLESQETGGFVTAVYGVLDEETMRWTYCNAGHNPPLWLRADGQVEWLWRGGPLLGAYADVSFGEDSIRMVPGDILVLYTDGITEALNDQGEEFGSERLVRVVMECRELPPEEICRRVTTAALAHEGGRKADDLTVVVVKAESAGKDR